VAWRGDCRKAAASLSFNTVAVRRAILRTMDAAPAPPASLAATAPAPWRGFDDLPGPPRRWWGLPLLAALRRDYLGFCERLQQEHGDLVRMRLAFERSVDLFDPELLREVLVDQADALIRWERGPAVFAELMGQSVLVTEGATWQRQRRMLMQAFTPKRVAGYAQLMAQAAGAALDRVLPSGATAGIVDIERLYGDLTMDVILRTLFGTPAGADCAGTGADLARAVQRLSDTGYRQMFLPFTLPVWLPGAASERRALRLLRELIRRHIERPARQPMTTGKAPTDLLAQLHGLHDEETGSALSAQEVFDQCMLTFQAGHETTATALTWWSWLLASHPQAAARAVAEVDQVLAGRAPEAADLPRLPWLGATLKEALRLYPPAAILMTRRALRPIHVGGYRLPARTLLRFTPWVLHRDERWFAQAQAFRPERFMPDAPQPPRSAYLPFGLGPRVCLGQHFALLEMTVAAALLLQRFTLAPLTGATPPQLLARITLRPRETLWLQLERR
jgi:cytochrome P450